MDKNILKNKDFVNSFFEKLLKNYKTNDISFKNILRFINSKKIVIPSKIGSADKLLKLLSEKHGVVVRDNGVGTNSEEYLVLRKTDPIPKEIYKQVKRIIIENFMTSELIPNSDIGLELKNNGINFKKYNYADLTSFLRCFSDIFNIVAQPTEIKNKVSIYVKIKKEFLEKYRNFHVDKKIKPSLLDNPDFYKMIEELYLSGKYGEILDQSNLKEAIKYINGDMWENIFKAYFKISGKTDSDLWKMTDWEKTVFNYEYLSENISDDFLIGYNISPELFGHIKKYVSEYSTKTLNYSMLGQRVSALCGEDNPLVEAIYNIGLLANISMDKSYCSRLLIIYYSRYREEAVDQVWEKYADSCINPSSMLMIVGTLFDEGKTELAEKLLFLYKKNKELSEPLQIYHKYSMRILGENTDELPALQILEKSRAIDLTAMVLKKAVINNDGNLFVEMIYCCLAFPEKYVSVKSVEELILTNSDFCKGIRYDILKKAKLKNIIHWTVLSYFVHNRIVELTDDWQAFCDAYREELISKINTCSADEKEKMISLSVEFFPTDPYFLNLLISYIVETKYLEDELINILYRGFSSLSYISMDDEITKKILSILGNYICPDNLTHEYSVTMMGLALNSGNIPMLSMLRCLLDRQTDDLAFVDFCERKIREKSQAYSVRCNDLCKTFEYFITQEEPKAIFDILRYGANIVRKSADESVYSFWKNDNNNEIDHIKFIITFISDADDVKAWKLLSQYSIKYQKYSLNFAANMIWLFRFKDNSFAAANCIRSLDRSIDSSLPKNFISLCITAWNTKMGEVLSDFQNAFINHIIRYNSFTLVNEDYVEKVFLMLKGKDKTDLNDIRLAIEIAKQSLTFGIFCEKLLANSNEYLFIVKHNVDIFVRLYSAFVSLSDDNAYKTWLDFIKMLRNEIGSRNLDAKDKSALMWIDDIISKRNEPIRDASFIQASMELLRCYPDEPSVETVNRWITKESAQKLPDYILFRNWINTYGNIKIIEFAENAVWSFTGTHPISKDLPELDKIYNLRLFLAEKYIFYYREEFQNIKYDFLRRCKTYYALRKLAKETEPVPAQISEKIKTELEKKKEYQSYLNFEKKTEQLLSIMENRNISEIMLYCGISNYWDTALEEWLKVSDEMIEYKDVIRSFLTCIDYRPLRRRLLQMYSYSSIAHIETEYGNVNYDLIRRQDEVKDFENKIGSNVWIFDEYINQLIKLISLLQPELLPLVKTAENKETVSEKLCIVYGLIFTLENKDLKSLRFKISSIDNVMLTESVIPAMVTIHYLKDIKEVLIQMAFSCDEKIEVILSSLVIQEVVGSANTSLFRSLYCIQKKDYSEASKYINEVDPNHTEYAVLYKKMMQSINGCEPLWIDSEDYDVSINVQDSLPHFSFIKLSEIEDDDFSRLVTDFYTEGLYDAKGKCLLARKIYSSIVNGNRFEDAQKFIFDWGFVEIDATYDIELKETYLFEMLENIEKLPNYINYKWQFVHQFSYLLQELDFSVLFKDFIRAYNCHKILYTKFHPYDNCDCYAQLFVLLKRLTDYGDKNNPDKAKYAVEQIKAQIIEVHLKYPQNRFANSCIGYADRYAQQILANGIFDVKILNKEKKFDNIIFYSIRNVGFELASDVVLTFSIANHPEAAQQINTKTLIPTGLRTNQVLAGEYIPNVNFADDEVIECSIVVEYNVVDEKGVTQSKSYTAPDMHENGKLQHTAYDNFKYHKDGRGGYNTESITQPYDFIGREEELNKILGKAVQGQNVLLYGTNGTGKSSLLQYLFNKALPDMYNEYYAKKDTASDVRKLGRLFIASPLKFDDDCSEKTVISSIISAITDDIRFKAFLKQYGEQNTIETVNMVADEWETHKEKIFDSEEKCLNTDLIRRYITSIDEVLQYSDIDVYILIDQFERIISSDRIESKHMLFIGDLVRRKIRFIIAGSNNLLEEVSVENKITDDSSWPVIFSRGFDQKVKIGNMSRNDFEKLITKKSALNDGEISYTDEALDFLWQYTNGHAFYSCLIANRTLDILSERGIRRRYIYPSDIFNAIYQSNKYLLGSKSDKEKEKAIKNQIFQDIYDNIPVKYVGKTLAQMQSRGESKISYRKLKDVIAVRRPDLLVSYPYALAVLQARDFVSYDELEVQIGEENPEDNADNYLSLCEYYFTSDLYLEHFVSVHIPELSDEERLALQNKNRSIEELITDLRTRKYTAQDICKIREEVKDIVGEGGNQYNNYYDKVYTGSAVDKSIQNQYNMQIQMIQINQTADSITAISELIDGIKTEKSRFNPEEISDRLKELPKLSLLSPGEDICGDDELAIYDTDHYVETVEEGVIKSFESNNKLTGLSLEEWVESNRTKLNQTGIEAEDIDYILSLAERDKKSIIISLYLRSLFDEIDMLSVDSNAGLSLDYSPVTIMLGKTIERILKERHLPIYLDRSVWVNNVKNYNENTPGASAVISFSGITTIGTFTTALFSMFSISNSDPERMEKEENRDNFVEKTGTDQGRWRRYTNILNRAKKIRNKTGHIEIVTKDDCNEFISILLNSKLLKNTIEYINV